MSAIHRLWRDEAAFVASSDLLLISTILVLGVIVGLVTYRDQVVQELGDVAAAVGAINQSYSFDAFTINFTIAPGNVVSFTAAGSTFDDLSDFCDEGDVAGAPPECIAIVASSEETP
jgi:hypothetical protein